MTSRRPVHNRQRPQDARAARQRGFKASKWAGHPDQNSTYSQDLEAGKEEITKWQVASGKWQVASGKFHKISSKGKEGTRRIINKYMGLVFFDRIGRMTMRPVKLRYKQGFKPVQPARNPVPYHYEERPTTHLKQLVKDGVIQKVDPAEGIACILNVAITEKKTTGSIRMNIDARPHNKRAKHTRYHITTP